MTRKKAPTRFTRPMAPPPRLKTRAVTTSGPLTGLCPSNRPARSTRQRRQQVRISIAQRTAWARASRLAPGSFIPGDPPELVEPVATVETAAYDYVSMGTEPQPEDTMAPPGAVASSISPAVADVVVDAEGARTGDMLPERGWGAMPIEALPRTPDLAASGVLAGPPRGSNGSHFRSEPEAFGVTSLPEAVYAAATAPAATPTSGPDGHGASSSSPASWSASLLGAPAPAPAVGPAAQARSTADALRKLTRRVPGASLPEEDDSLRRPTSTSTTSNPLGLSGALSQYLSVTVEGRPEKEHNPR